MTEFINCPYCNKEYLIDKKLQEKQNEKIPDITYTCPYCKLQFKPEYESVIQYLEKEMGLKSFMENI